MAWGIWGIIALILVIIEMFTVDLTFLMIAGGALAAMITAFFPLSWPVQIAVFAIVAVLLLGFVRPVIRKHTATSTKRESNVYAIAGQKVRALTDITKEGGRAKIGGDEWSAKTMSGFLKAGDIAVVDHVDGVHLVLTAKDSSCS